MVKKLPTLPIGQADFSTLRKSGRLYVDKTDLLTKLILEGDYYFLSRPRRFGKSLTISTLKAMFFGKHDLFNGLAAEHCVREQREHPSPVLHLDLSAFGDIESPKKFDQGLRYALQSFAARYKLSLPAEDDCDLLLSLVLEAVHQSSSQVVMLIDEYDYPLLNCLDDVQKLASLRKRLRGFYTVIKACAEHLRFVFITGISKFTKSGIFSAMNNLIDISMEETYAALTGYTQQELENNFSFFIEDALHKNIAQTKAELLYKIKSYYDGFSFDGKTKVYNPFSILNFFRKYTFSNYWYESGSSTFMETYCKTHNIESPEKYHFISVPKTKMAAREIEKTDPEILLFQAGYLTIAQDRGDTVLLDYPNQEVLSALSEMYLQAIYTIPDYHDVGKRLWEAVYQADLPALIREYNAAIAALPYHDFSQDKHRQQRDESFYRSLFLMLLRGCGLQAHAEMPTCRGRSDVVIACPQRILVIEWKLAKNATEIAAKRREGEEQIRSQGYLEPYAASSIPVNSAVFVVDAQKRQLVL